MKTHLWKIIAAIVVLFGVRAYAQSYHVLKKLGEGGNAQVYKIDGHGKFTVLKVYKPHVLFDAPGGAVYVAKQLRADPEFGRRFGDVIPDTINGGWARVLQERKRGSKLAELAPSGAGRTAAARSNARSIIQYAQRKFPHLRIDESLENFLFDANTGRVTGWVDQLWGQ